MRQQALNGRPDTDLASACRSERRAIVTLDLDFSDITAFPPEQYAGIIVLRVRSQSRPHIVAVFESVLPLLDTEPLDGTSGSWKKIASGCGAGGSSSSSLWSGGLLARRPI